MNIVILLEITLTVFARSTKESINVPSKSNIIVFIILSLHYLRQYYNTYFTCMRTLLWYNLELRSERMKEKSSVFMTLGTAVG